MRCLTCTKILWIARERDSIDELVSSFWRSRTPLALSTLAPPRAPQGGSSCSHEVLLIRGDRQEQNSELCGYYFLWVELCPQKRCWSPNPHTCECDLIWKLSLCRCNKLRWGHTWVCVLGGALICDWHPYKDKGIWKQRHTCGGETMGRQSRDWGDTAASQGTPRVAGSHKKPKERIVTDSPQGHRRGRGPTGTWFSDF